MGLRVAYPQCRICGLASLSFRLRRGKHHWLFSLRTAESGSTPGKGHRRLHDFMELFLDHAPVNKHGSPWRPRANGSPEPHFQRRDTMIQVRGLVHPFVPSECAPKNFYHYP